MCMYVYPQFENSLAFLSFMTYLQYAVESINEQVTSNPSEVFFSSEVFSSDETARRHPPPSKLYFDRVLVAVQSIGSHGVGYKMFLAIKSDTGMLWRCWVEVMARTIATSSSLQEGSGRQHALKLVSPLQLHQLEGGDSHICPERHDVHAATIAACCAMVQNPQRVKGHNCDALVAKLAQVLKNGLASPLGNGVCSLWARLQEGRGHQYEILLSLDTNEYSSSKTAVGIPGKAMLRDQARKKPGGNGGVAWNPAAVRMIKCRLSLPIGARLEEIQLLSADVVESVDETSQLLATFFTAIEMGAVRSEIQALRQNMYGVENLRRELKDKEDLAQQLKGIKCTRQCNTTSVNGFFASSFSLFSPFSPSCH
jgi:hypothetical protein